MNKAKRYWRAIEPLALQNPVPQQWCTWDTEAYRYEAANGEDQVFAVGSVYDGTKSWRFDSLSEFINIIMLTADNAPGDLYVYAHNAVYDLSLTGLKKDIIMGDKLGGFTRAGRYMIEHIVIVKYKRHRKINGVGATQYLYVLDSYQLLHAGLAALSKSFLKQEKYATTDEYAMPPPKWNAFISSDGYNLAAQDSKQLYDILGAFFSNITALSVPFSHTLPSCAFLHFRHKFLKRTLKYPNRKDYVMNILEAYRGGINNLYKPGSFSVSVDYDVNSLYATAMLKPMPGSFLRRTGALTMGDYLGYHSNNYVIAKVEFELPGSVEMSFIVKKMHGKLIPLQAGSLWLHTPEIDWLIKHGASIKITDSYLYELVPDLFRDYVDFWFGIKKKATAEGDSALRDISKLFLTSLYGKTGQHKSYSVFTPNSTPAQVQAPSRLLVVNKDGTKVFITNYGYFTSVIDEQDPKYSPELAGATTAYSRIILADYVERAGIGNVIYVDTDSIHCTGHYLDDCLGSGLGELKIEAEGPAVYRAPKVYNIGDVVKFKGVNVRRAEKLTDKSWRVRQFSRTKDVKWSGVSVRDKIKTMTFTNDKFKWVNGKAVCWRQDELE